MARVAVSHVVTGKTGVGYLVSDSTGHVEQRRVFDDWQCWAAHVTYNNIDINCLRSGSALVSINEVNLRLARLVLGWVTVSGFNSRCWAFISVCIQPPGSTQPGHPFEGRRNEYQPKGGDALQLKSKGRYGSCVGGR